MAAGRETIRAFADLERIFAASVKRVDPYDMIISRVKIVNNMFRIVMETGTTEIDLSRFDRIVVLGAGKATAKMALAIEDIFRGRIADGVIAVKPGHTERLERIGMIEAGHPVPDEGSIRAAERIADFAEAGDERTLFINLVSGGGSALLSYPMRWRQDGQERRITLEEKQATTKALLACGATIGEINCIRKHISGIKGGRLAALMHPATSVNLILSDVVGDRLDSIASGLTAPDGTTYRDALDLLAKYGIEDRVPPNVLRLLRDGSEGNVPETPKAGDAVFSTLHNVLLGTNFSALLAARAEAESLGYNCAVLSSQVTGEAREIAHFYSALGRDARSRQIPARTPACIIAGGETTVTLRGKGMGGRNQEMALSFLGDIAWDRASSEGVYFLSAGTDGNDGPTDAAGAFASTEVLDAAEAAGLSIQEYLAKNDSYHFFDRIGYLLKTGPTNTNVCDLQIVIVQGEKE